MKMQSLSFVLCLQLERMKNDNMLPTEDGQNHEARFPSLQRELTQLHEVNVFFVPLITMNHIFF
jgi:hypothetical protein